jgi:NTE family protein
VHIVWRLRPGKHCGNAPLHPEAPRMKTVVVFQGGGALGAFASGVWQSLAPWLRAQDAQLVSLAGASIGAINAAVLAHRLHEPDLGAGHLVSVWRDELTTPSLPFFGWPLGDHEWARMLRSWNGFLSGVFVGNRGLYRPCFHRWNLWDDLQRFERPLFERSAMRSLLEAHAPGYASEGQLERPLLGVSATAVVDGELRLFDSDETRIAPAHLLASTAIPALFDPVTIEGRAYWDGELVRDSLLSTLVKRLRTSGRLQAGEPLLLVTVEQLPRQMAALPRSGPEITYRVLNLMQLAKLAPQTLSNAGDGVQWLRIRRPPLDHDAISGQFDYSPERVEQLIEQGREACAAALPDHAPA